MMKEVAVILVRCVMTIAVVMVTVAVHAQDKTWTDGELEDVQIEIVNEREITLPKANRNFEKIPPRSFEPIKPPITYDFQVINFKAPEVSPLIRPLKLKQSEASSVYGNYISLGYGNFASPYAEAFLNSRKDKDKLVGVHAWHTSSGKGPVDGKNSGNGNSGVSLFGKTFGKSISLEGNIGFENSSTHFYGYPSGMEVSRDTIRQSYNEFSLGGTLSNTKNTDFEYQLGANFSHLSDKFDAQETMVDLNFRSSYTIDKETAIRLNAGYSMANRKDELIDGKARSLFQVNGAYEFSPMEELTMHAGLVVAFENDTIGSKDLHVYPDIVATYRVTPSVDVIGSLTGGIDKVSLHSLYRENIWLGPNIPIFHTSRSFEFQAALRARLGKQVEVHAGIAAASLKNFYYFTTTEEEISKFEPAYDLGSTKRSNLFASLSYAQSEKAKFTFRGDVFSYTPADMEEAWHRPTYRLAASAYYNVYDKILLKGDLIMQGGMKAFDPEALETVKLDAAFDLNARVEYLFSESFSFFVQLNNITSGNYPLFLNYPVRGLQVMGGITWSF